MVNSFSGSFTLTTSINHVNVQYLKCRTQWLWIFIPLAFVLKYATILNFKCDNGKAPNGVEKIESQAKQKTETTNILWFRFIHSIGKLLLIHCKWEDTHTHTHNQRPRFKYVHFNVSDISCNARFLYLLRWQLNLHTVRIQLHVRIKCVTDF